MWNKRGKLSTLLVVCVFILPILGLLIMDYQVKRANDITGAYLSGGVAAYAYENMLAGFVVAGMVVITVLALIVVKVRNSRLISTMPLARINQEIEKIDEHLRQKIH